MDIFENAPFFSFHDTSKIVITQYDFPSDFSYKKSYPVNAKFECRIIWIRFSSFQLNLTCEKKKRFLFLK